MPNFSPAALAAALILAASPAFAQRQVEFGYKDRIFEQNYLLPENVSALDARAVVVMLALRLPGSRDLRLISAMGGQCGATFVHDNDVERGSSPEATPIQLALDQVRAEARIGQPQPGPMGFPKQPVTFDEACVLQEVMFANAYRDSLSTESQLASLAKGMRRRFARSWVPPEKMKDPAWLLGAERLSLSTSRAHRILRVDPTKLEPGKQTVAEMIAGYMDMDMAAFEAALAEWDAREAEVLAEAQARLETVKTREREEQQRRQAEAAERQAKQARAEEDEHARREARRAEEAAREEALRAQEAERVRRVREERARQLAGHTGPGTVPAAPSSQLQASLEPTPQDADRLAQVRRLEARQAELGRTIARLEGRLAHQQGAVLRNPLNLQGALTSIAGISQARADLDQAQAERRDVTRALQRLRKAAAPSQAAVATRAEPVVAAGDGECQLGGQCHVIALTLFCRTPQQMAAILSQRPGPARKQVLDALTTSDDCRQVSAGQVLQWTAPITSIQPNGESMAELVPGSLADGTPGFMLKDEVIARSGGVAR